MIYKVIVSTGKYGNGTTSIYNPSKENMLLLNPRLSLNLNEPGTFEFTIPPTNRGYNAVHVRTSTIDVVENGKIIWTGRPVSVEYDFYNNKTFRCEGALAYFKDIVMEEKEYKKTTITKFFKSIISRYNDGVMATTNDDIPFDYARTFTAGSVTAGSNLSIWRKTSWESAWECLEDMLLNAEGGYFILSKNAVGINPVNIKYVGEFTETCNQTIEFGSNLVNVARSIDTGNIVTDIIPVCHYDDKTYMLQGFENENDNYRIAMQVGNDIKPDARGHIVNYALRRKHGVCEKTIEYDMVENLQSTEDLETKEARTGEPLNESELNQLAAIRANNNAIILNTLNYMFENSMEKMEEAEFGELVLDISAADLRNISDPDTTISNFRLGQLVHVVSEPHDIDATLPVTAIEINLENGVKQVTIGKPEKRELTKILKPKDNVASYNGSGSGQTRSGNTDSGKHVTTNDYPDTPRYDRVEETDKIKYTKVRETAYTVGDSVNLSEFAVGKLKTDGSYDDITENCTFTILGTEASGYTFNEKGSYTMTAHYTYREKEHTCDTMLGVLNPLMNEIRFTDVHGSYNLGENLNYADFSIIGVFQDGSTKQIPMNDSHLRLNLSNGTTIAESTPEFFIAYYSSEETDGTVLDAQTRIRGEGSQQEDDETPSARLEFARYFGGTYNVGDYMSISNYSVYFYDENGGVSDVTYNCTYNIGVDAKIVGGVEVEPADYTATGVSKHQINGYEPEMFRATYTRPGGYEYTAEVPLSPGSYGLPESIEIITQPTKLTYTEGEMIDLTGAVVSAKKSNGETWTSSQYPNGHIPLGELVVEPRTVNRALVMPEYKRYAATSNIDIREWCSPKDIVEYYINKYPDVKFIGINSMLSDISRNVSDVPFFATLTDFTNDEIAINADTFTFNFLTSITEPVTTNGNVYQQIKYASVLCNWEKTADKHTCTFVRVQYSVMSRQPSYYEGHYENNGNRSVYNVSSINAIMPDNEAINLSWKRPIDQKELKTSFTIDFGESASGGDSASGGGTHF